MTDRELLQQALDALSNFDKGNHGMRWQVPIIKALRARLAQPEPILPGGGIGRHPDIPTKLMGPNLEGILNAAGFVRQKKWISLTDDELHALHYELKVQMQGAIGTIGMYRILEKALREKNT